MNQKKSYKKMIIIVLVLFISLHLVTEFYPYNGNLLNDLDSFKKLAWDDLEEGTKTSVVTGTDDMYIESLDSEGDLIIIFNEEVQNVDNIWAYGEVRVIAYHEIGWIDSIDIINERKYKVLAYIKRNKPIVEVVFHTTMDGLLGPITVYIDPKDERILGYHVRL